MKTLFKLGTFVFIAFGISSLFSAVGEARKRGAQAQAAQPAVHVPPKRNLPAGYDPSKKTERDELVTKLMKDGWIGAVNPGISRVEVEVRATILGLDFEKQQSFAGMMMAWGLDHGLDTQFVVFLDPRTHKELAKFDTTRGLRWK